MAHYAQLDETNKVIQVIVIHNNELITDGKESEQKGIEFCKGLFGADTKWVQTSYNASFRKHFAGVGYTYDEVKDVFVPPQTYPSWVLDTNDYIWKAPKDRPQDSNIYSWDETKLEWVAMA